MGAEKGIKRLSLLLFMAAFLAFFVVLSVSQGAAQIDLQAVIQALYGDGHSQYSVTSYRYGHVCRH